MKIWAIGDIHGRSDLLDIILEELEKSGLDLSQDKLIFLGDYVDRGSDSKGVVQRVMQLDQNDNVVCLLGNHDEFLIDAVTHNDYNLWASPVNGGEETLKSFGCGGVFMNTPDLKKIPQEVIDWFKARPLYYKIDQFFFSHAPLPRENKRGRYKGMDFQDHEYTWTRPNGDDEFGICRRISPTKDGGSSVIGVCGHNKISFTPRLFDHYYCIDTGCGCHPSAPLTAIECTTKTIIQADPKKLPGHKEALIDWKEEQKAKRKRMQHVWKGLI